MRWMPLLLLCALIGVETQAASRALIVGVGINEDPNTTNLINSGIPEDVGFRPG